jgi:hypothetical protein
MESQTCIILNFAAGIKILIDMLDLGHPGAKLHVGNPLLGHGHTRSHEGTCTAWEPAGRRLPCSVCVHEAPSFELCLTVRMVWSARFQPQLTPVQALWLLLRDPCQHTVFKGIHTGIPPLKVGNGQHGMPSTDAATLLCQVKRHCSINATRIP